MRKHTHSLKAGTVLPTKRTRYKIQIIRRNNILHLEFHGTRECIFRIFMNSNMNICRYILLNDVLFSQLIKNQ